MALIRVDQPRYEQPADRASFCGELSQHAVGLILPSSLDREVQVVGASNAYAIRSGGVAHTHGATTSFLKRPFDNPYPSFARTRHLLVGQFRLTAAPAADRAVIFGFGSTTGSTGNSIFAVGCDPSGTIQVLVGHSLANGSWFSTGVSALDYKPHTVVVETNSIADYTFRRRVSVDGYSSSDIPDLTGTAVWMRYDRVCSLGYQRTSDIGGELNAEVFLVAGFMLPLGEGYFLPAAALSDLSGNPWSLFEPRRIWVPQAAASGLPTLGTVSASAITSSGFRPSVTYTY